MSTESEVVKEKEVDEPSYELDLEPEAESEDNLGSDTVTVESEDDADLGKGAQARIRKLVSQSKDLEAQNAELRQRLVALEENSKTQQESLTQATAARLKSVQGQLESRMKMAEDKLALAIEEGNARDASEATREVSLIQTNLSRLAEQMAYQEQMAKRAPAPQQEVQQPVQQPDARAVEWFESHKTFLQANRSASLTAVGIHQELVDEGIDPRYNEDEYYAELDNRLSKRFPEMYENSKKGSPVTPGKGAAQRKGSKIKLSATEVEKANALGIPLERWAEAKKRVQAKREA